MRVTPRVLAGLHPGLGPRQLADLSRDAAFDLYLEFLSSSSAWDKAGLVFKGGTAVRKFHCPPQDYHRISYDLDFALLDASARPGLPALPALMSSSTPRNGLRFALTLGSHSRVRVEAPFLATPLSVGFDAAASPMLQEPRRLPLLHRPVHGYYDVDMSFTVPVMSVDETVAEKLTRWQQRPLVRDLYDLMMLRPLVVDPAATARMWVIKSHRSYHNPDKGPTMSMPQPVDLDAVIDDVDIALLKLASLQFDVPMADPAKQDLVEGMLASFPEAYFFCAEELDAEELAAWGSDTTGRYTSAVTEAADAMRSPPASAPPQSGTALSGLLGGAAATPSPP